MSQNLNIMIRTVQFTVGIVLLIALEILRVYFIMPFPGSQRSESIDLAYFIHTNIFYFRMVGWLIILFPMLYFFWMGRRRAKVLTAIGLAAYIFIFYLFNFRFLADKMFYQPRHKVFASASANKIPDDDLVLGVRVNNEAKAYPIEVIGYHHQVRDTVGNEPVMITYCTVCRTGRAYRPFVDGQPEQFRLVGMDHFNAMFEDASTGSWWRQVSGEAIAGPAKGKTLPEIPSEQMTLKAWLELYPGSGILQPDTTFNDRYKGLEKFDEGTTESDLIGRDSLSWKDKSWIVGVQLGMHSRAYDWNDLMAQRVINDTLAGTQIVVVLEPDSASFHVWERDSLHLAIDTSGEQLKDLQTGSAWNWQGRSTQGTLEGKKLPVIQAYQEFWHSWKTFRPQTTAYQPKKNTP
jgi:hypothetical protein